MEQLRNEGVGETGDPRENPRTSGIIRCDSHMRKLESDPAGNRTRFGHSDEVAILLASPLGEPGSIPGGVIVYFLLAEKIREHIDKIYRYWEITSGIGVRRCPLIGGSSRGYLVPPAISFQRCYTLNSLHPHRLSIPRCSEPPKSLHSLIMITVVGCWPTKTSVLIPLEALLIDTLLIPARATYATRMRGNVDYVQAEEREQCILTKCLRILYASDIQHNSARCDGSALLLQRQSSNAMRLCFLARHFKKHQMLCEAYSRTRVLCLKAYQGTAYKLTYNLTTIPCLEFEPRASRTLDRRSTNRLRHRRPAGTDDIHSEGWKASNNQGRQDFDRVEDIEASGVLHGFIDSHTLLRDAPALSLSRREGPPTHTHAHMHSMNGSAESGRGDACVVSDVLLDERKCNKLGVGRARVGGRPWAAAAATADALRSKTSRTRLQGAVRVGRTWSGYFPLDEADAWLSGLKSTDRDAIFRLAANISTSRAHRSHAMNDEPPGNCCPALKMAAGRRESPPAPSQLYTKLESYRVLEIKVTNCTLLEAIRSMRAGFCQTESDIGHVLVKWSMRAGFCQTESDIGHVLVKWSMGEPDRNQQ
ncbi:hypothetical protein PR048_013448, partial [Dryococelus australis]